MEQSKQQRIRELTDRLNRCRYEYYNLNAPSLTDAEYDALFDELSALEKETGFNLTNSPTQTVGCYPAVSTLEKTTHKIPLLSLDKTKSSTELLRFAGEQMVMLMLKLDGLTVKLTYEKGLLMEAATRGDGDTGENITHNVMGISGIPDKISYKDRLVVTGEAFIRPSDFVALKDTLRDGNGEPYKNGRNLAAGSVRLLDCGACKDRRVTFMAFNVLEGLTEEYPWKSQRLRAIEQLGFPVCKYLASKQALTQFDMDAGIRHLRKYAQENDIPIDGIVVTYNDAAYAKSCGRTGHHYKDGLAFKFEDDTYETVLRSIEWTPSRTGEITPVAVFDTVEIDGCAVSRASLHNLSFIENLELMPGCRIKVSKRNQIIPHVEENLDRDCYAREKVVPARCPCCGQPTRIHMTKNTVNGEEKVTAALFCDNEQCETRKLRTCSLYDYAYNYPSEDDDGLIVFNDTYGAGYKMAKSSSLYNGSGTATTSISSYTRVWFNSDAGTAGATKPYLVTISGYSTYANNKWTYHSISATTFVDAGFNTGKVSTYKMNTLQE